MLGVIGRSGAGKSTLLRMINRLDRTRPPARSGSATLDVTPLAGKALREWRARAAMIFQQFNLVPRLDVLTNVLIGRLSHRAALPVCSACSRPRNARSAMTLLERFGLAEVALQRAGTLSGGQQQRVAICRALLQEPLLILADEPIASLDPHNARVVMEALRTVNRQDGLTVLACLHHLDAARAWCDRVIALQAGRIVFDGTPAQLSPAKVFDIYGVTEEEFHADHAPLVHADDGSVPHQYRQVGVRSACTGSRHPAAVRAADDADRRPSPACRRRVRAPLPAVPRRMARRRSAAYAVPQSCHVPPSIAGIRGDRCIGAHAGQHEHTLGLRRGSAARPAPPWSCVHHRARRSRRVARTPWSRLGGTTSTGRPVANSAARRACQLVP